MNRKRGLALLLAVCMFTGMPHVAEIVFATSATEKKEEAEDKYNEANSEIEDLENSQQNVEDKLAQTRVKLGKLLSSQKELEDEIAATQAAMAQTEKELEEAEADAKEQYEAMKLRIQYMYENSTQDSLLEAILGAKSLADLLKRVEYVAAVHKADRELTKEYMATVERVEDKQTMLLAQMDELLMKQEVYLGQQLEIESMIASLEGEYEEFNSQLASAKEKADAFKKEMERQEEIMRKEEEERKRLEEEKKRQEEEEKKKQEAANGGNSGNTGNTGNNEVVSAEAQAIVDYALQFVGNPYVWGGNSLTNGCDCSGFVHLIYKHFGYNTPRYSLSFQYVGRGVDIEDIQPGDIVVYAKNGEGVGHVAIYIGNGKIVEAQSTKAGITSNRNLHNNRAIIAVRRLVD
jgi:cell wall-associated NlpC family hydrolase